MGHIIIINIRLFFWICIILFYFIFHTSKACGEGLRRFSEGHYFAQVLCGQFNLCCSTGCPDRLSQVQQAASSKLAASGFALREWASNYPDYLQNCSPKDYCDQPVVKVLGYLYNIPKVALQLKLTSLDSKVSTRRRILSQIYQIFDPVWFQTFFRSL